MVCYPSYGTLQRQAPHPPEGRQYIHRWLSVALMLLFLTPHTQAQEGSTIFLTEGKIEFEKKVNLYALMEDNSWSDLQKKSMPQFKTTYYDLLFTHDKTLFRPGRENPDNNRSSRSPPKTTSSIATWKRKKWSPRKRSSNKFSW